MASLQRLMGILGLYGIPPTDGDSPIGKNVAILWFLYGSYMVIIWLSYGYPMLIIWLLYGYYTNQYENTRPWAKMKVSYQRIPFSLMTFLVYNQCISDISNLQIKCSDSWA